MKFTGPHSVRMSSWAAQLTGASGKSNLLIVWLKVWTFLVQVITSYSGCYQRIYQIGHNRQCPRACRMEEDPIHWNDCLFSGCGKQIGSSPSWVSSHQQRVSTTSVGPHTLPLSLHASMTPMWRWAWSPFCLLYELLWQTKFGCSISWIETFCFGDG